MRSGQSFEDAEVANAYRYRPDYPRQIFEKLTALSPNHQSVLDLGCGTGKIARGLAGSFESVTALDASQEMLRIGQSLQRESTSNIRWIHGLAETARFNGKPFDLIVAAASIHWMDHSVVFPRLVSMVRACHVFAVVDGDGAFEPPWREEWDDFLRYWIPEVKGERYEPENVESAFVTQMTKYRDWVEVTNETAVMSDPVTQSVQEFVACQHSRDTFAPARLGSRLQRFDTELTALLAPYATDGSITYSVRTLLTWGSLKT